MLLALRQDGQLTAGDLARIGNVAPSTASQHLARLVAAGLIGQTRSGRRRYYRIVVPDLVEVLDGIENIADREAPLSEETLSPAQIHSRLCYDHLAGRLGCELTSAFFDRGLLRHTRDGVALTRDGRLWLARGGTDIAAIESAPRRVALLCRDWGQDRHHLGGAAGAAVLEVLKRRDWIRLRRGRIEAEMTPRGYAGLRTEFGLELHGAAP